MAWLTRNRWNELEFRMDRCVEIESVDTGSALAKCNLQEASPLFSQLPREIRILIWAYSTAPFEDEEHKYHTTEFYYRPGHTARWKSDTNLLLTCRRIWLEANTFPMLQAEHCFWFFRAAPDGRNKEWMESLTDLNRKNFGELHIFAQMFVVENALRKPGQLRKYFLDSPPHANDCLSRVFRLTIRHTDWWWWERDEPLRFEDSVVQAFLDTEVLRSTETIKLELETLTTKVDQLLPIVERLERLESKEYETHMVDGAAVSTRFVLHGGRETNNWSGPANLDNKSFWPYKDSDQLNYEVITLTWKLKFPQISCAHVPTLRCAPRIVQTDTPVQFSSKSRKCVDEVPHAYQIRSRLPWKGPFRKRPLRRRDYKKLKAGLWPARMEQTILDMMNDETEVRTMSMCQALSQEAMRQRQFVEAMEPMILEACTRICEKGNTLLRFAE